MFTNKNNSKYADNIKTKEIRTWSRESPCLKKGTPNSEARHHVTYKSSKRQLVNPFNKKYK